MSCTSCTRTIWTQKVPSTTPIAQVSSPRLFTPCHHPGFNTVSLPQVATGISWNDLQSRDFVGTLGPGTGGVGGHVVLSTRGPMASEQGIARSSVAAPHMTASLTSDRLVGLTTGTYPNLTGTFVCQIEMFGLWDVFAARTLVRD